MPHGYQTDAVGVEESFALCQRVQMRWAIKIEENTCTPFLLRQGWAGRRVSVRIALIDLVGSEGSLKRGEEGDRGSGPRGSTEPPPLPREEEGIRP